MVTMETITSPTKAMSVQEETTSKTSLLVRPGSSGSLKAFLLEGQEAVQVCSNMIVLKNLKRSLSFKCGSFCENSESVADCRSIHNLKNYEKKLCFDDMWRFTMRNVNTHFLKMIFF